MVAFCEMGLYGLTTETLTATLNLFLQHYNMTTALWITLTTSLESLQLQLVLSKCPLLYDYNTWSRFTTDSWVK